MDLHQAGPEPDWMAVPPKQRNGWQRIACRTGGIVTPANLLSLLGAVIVLRGLEQLLQGQLLVGLVLMAVGRLADAFDGMVAHLTGTKSRLGALFDASVDKLIALLTLIVFVDARLIPLWLGGLIAAQNLANALITIFGQARKANVLPSRLGKNATAGYWIGLLGFLLVRLLPEPISAAVHTAAYIVSILSLALGMLATVGYFRFAWEAAGGALRESRFKRYVIIRNPVSTEDYKAGERIHTLQELQPESAITILETVSGGREDNARLLRQHASLLGPNTLLCIAAGDGTIHMLLNILLHDTRLPEESRHTPILPLWCGNANDLAYMLNGAWSPRKLRKILSRGTIVRVKPVDVTLTSPKGTLVAHTAACYASFGATAYASYELEHALPRKSPVRRFLLSRVSQEWRAAIRALLQAPTFRITSHDRERTIYERTYLNGSRFAKIIGIPLKLTDDKFHRITIERKHPFAVALRLLGLLNSRDIPKRAITHDAFTILDDVWAQFDGEPVRLEANVEVAVNVSDQPFYALSTRLR